MRAERKTYTAKKMAAWGKQHGGGKIERYWRPKTRADCAKVMRPCPFVACKYHLFTEVQDSGALTFPFGDDLAALKRMPATCALDVADRGAHDSSKLAEFLNVTMQGISNAYLLALMRLSRRRRLHDLIEEGEAWVYRERKATHLTPQRQRVYIRPSLGGVVGEH